LQALILIRLVIISPQVYFPARGASGHQPSTGIKIKFK